MLNLGVIGTGWIAQKFVEAAMISKRYRLHSVYSRKISTAETFSEKFKQKSQNTTDFAQFLADEKLDVVYIASPNSLHFVQAKSALLAGKHVIVEKPAFSNPNEMAEIIKLAETEKCFYFEAAKHFHEDSFEIIRQLVKQHQVIGASLNFAKYSSKMVQLLAGDLPNIFNPAFSTGALADLGVYLLYAALGWFGMPKASKYYPTMLDSGVDGLGSGILFYQDFNVNLSVGKTVNSYQNSEIYFSDGTLIIDHISAISAVDWLDLKGNKTTIEIQTDENSMLGEAQAFFQVIQNQTLSNLENYQEWLELSRNVNQVLTDMRRDAGIVFAAD